MATTREEDHAIIKNALTAARVGGASVTQLAIAHELSEKYRLAHVTSELRSYIRNQIPDPTSESIALARTLCVGVVCGLMTNFVLMISIRRKASI